MRCGCNLSLAARMAYLMYVGGRMAKSAPPGARVRAARFLPADRPHLVPHSPLCQPERTYLRALGEPPEAKAPSIAFLCGFSGLTNPERPIMLQ